MGTEKRGGDTKILKWEGKLGQGVGALKTGETGLNSLTNYGHFRTFEWMGENSPNSSCHI